VDSKNSDEKAKREKEMGSIIKKEFYDYRII